MQHQNNQKNGARRKIRWLATLGSALLCTAIAPSLTWAQAQKWPSQPLRVIVPYPAAGAADIAARIVGQRLSQRLGQPIVIDNHPGAVGSIATSIVAKAAPDGYTLLAATNPEITIVRHLRRTLPYNPDTDLIPLLRTANAPIVLVARGQDGQFVDFKSLLDQARANPNKLTYATPGIGTPMHLMMESILKETGVKIHHIPYNGGTRAMADLIGGQVNVLAITLSTVAGQIKSGRVKALAMLQAERSPVAPEVPTLREAGGVNVLNLPSVWFAWFAPVNTPPAILTRLSTELKLIASEPAVQEAFRQAGLEPLIVEPPRLNQLLREESEFFYRASKPFAEQ